MDPQKILNHLVDTEFKELKYPWEEYSNIKVRWKNSLRVRILRFFGIRAREGATAWLEYYEWGFKPIIYLNKLHKEKFLRNENATKEVLRHECLHLLFDYPVSALEFNKEAHKRKIGYEGKKIAGKEKELYYYGLPSDNFCCEKINLDKMRVPGGFFRAKDKKLIIDNIILLKGVHTNDTLVVEIPAGEKVGFTTGNLGFQGTATGKVRIEGRKYRYFCLEIEIIPLELYFYSQIEGDPDAEKCISLGQIKRSAFLLLF